MLAGECCSNLPMWRLRIARFVTETGQLRILHPALQSSLFQALSARVNDNEKEERETNADFSESFITVTDIFNPMAS